MGYPVSGGGGGSPGGTGTVTVRNGLGTICFRGAVTVCSIAASCVVLCQHQTKTGIYSDFTFCVFSALLIHR